MNRTYQLKDTLPTNISNNEDYKNLEFILLDYNSADEMEVWVKTHLQAYIKSGRLKYYKTFQPSFFNHSHAKNLALKLSNAEILCSINADHFTGKNFAFYVNEVFNKNQRIVITPIPPHFYNRTAFDPPGELWGKFCIKKTDFLTVGGLDEQMIKFGNDDIDFVNRLNLSGISSFLLNKPEFGKFISHDNETRYSTKKKISELKNILISYLDPSSSALIFLFNNLHFEKLTITDTSLKGSENYFYSFQQREFKYRYEIKDLDWLSGIYEENEHGVILSASQNKGHLSKKSVHGAAVFQCLDTNKVYYPITDRQIINELLELNYVFYNQNIMLKNLNDKIINVNNSGFGKAMVYKNFDYETPLLVE